MALAVALGAPLALAAALGGCDRPAPSAPAPSTPAPPNSAPAGSAAASDGWSEYQGSWSGTGARRTIPFGADRQASTIHLSGTLLLAGEGRPGVGFRAEVVALVDSRTGLTGRAVWTDDRGDQVFSELKGEGTREAHRITGTLVGGTGRYAGVTGDYEFSWQFTVEPEEGAFHGRAVGFKGRYRLAPRAGEGPPP